MKINRITDSLAIWVSSVLNSDEVFELVMASIPYTFNRIAILSEGKWAFGSSVVIVQNLDTGDLFVLTFVISKRPSEVNRG